VISRGAEVSIRWALESPFMRKFAWVLATLLYLIGASVAWSAERSVYACTAAGDDYFANEVWPKVGVKTCLECHKAGGDAEDSEFVLVDPQRSAGGADAAEAVLRQNREAFAAMGRAKEGDQSRLLLKVVGKLKHGGKQVIHPDSAAYGVLAEFVRRLAAPPSEAAVARALGADKDARPFFDGVTMLDDRRLLRRVTLSLAGRLPTAAESAAVGSGGREARTWSGEPGQRETARDVSAIIAKRPAAVGRQRCANARTAR